MKDFNDFKVYVRDNGREIHDSIVAAVNASTQKQQFSDPGEEMEFHTRAWVELGFMELLEHYHNWLNSES